MKKCYNKNMKKKRAFQLKKDVKKINEVLKIKGKIDVGQKIIGEVDTLNKIISDTLYIKDNVAVDLKNFSLISITTSKDIL
jgi:hypothetical protein